MGDARDFLDEVMDERSAANAAFPAMVEAAYERRRRERIVSDAHEQPGRVEAPRDGDDDAG
jgi:hypothetical protein